MSALGSSKAGSGVDEVVNTQNVAMERTVTKQPQPHEAKPRGTRRWKRNMEFRAFTTQRGYVLSLNDVGSSLAELIHLICVLEESLGAEKC